MPTWEMIEDLASRYKVEECNFNTIFGTFHGCKSFGSRKVAEKIEIQAQYVAELHNLDVRQIKGYLAEKALFLGRHEDIGIVLFSHPLNLHQCSTIYALLIFQAQNHIRTSIWFLLSPGASTFSVVLRGDLYFQALNPNLNLQYC
jgi:hypothetical protein